MRLTSVQRPHGVQPAGRSSWGRHGLQIWWCYWRRPPRAAEPCWRPRLHGLTGGLISSTFTGFLTLLALFFGALLHQVARDATARRRIWQRQLHERQRYYK